MKMTFLLPEDRDVSNAPVGGALYFDAKVGRDTNSGTSPSAPKQHFSRLPNPLPVGNYYFRNGRQYKVEVPPPVYGGTACILSVAGTVENPSSLIGWGDGPPAMLGGDIYIDQEWGDVTEDYGNTWLSEHGYEVEVDPQCTVWHAAYLGGEMLTPAVWAPSAPADLSLISRHDYAPQRDDSEVCYLEPTANVQSWTSPASNVAVTRDMTMAAKPSNVTFASTAVSDGAHTLTVWFRHPAIAEHYGDDLGPVGGAVFFRSNPTNRVMVAYITEYDYATQTIKAVASRNSDRRYPGISTGVQWWVIGHPFDARQPGQYGCTIPASGRPKLVFVPGDYLRGRLSIARWSKVLRANSGYLNIENMQMGRFAGLGRAYVNLTTSGPEPDAVETWALYCAGSGNRLRNVSFGQTVTGGTSTFVYGDTNSKAMDAVDIFVDGGGILGGFTQAFNVGTIDGLTMRNLGHTGFQMSSSNGTVITDMLIENCVNWHGNGLSNYNGSPNNKIRRSAGIDVVRLFTSQGSAAEWPRGLEYSDILMLGARPLNPDPVAVSDSYTLRIDSSFGGCLIDRVLMGDGEFEFHGEPVANYGNDDAVVRRSHFSRLETQVGESFIPMNGGGPPQFQHVNIASGKTDPATEGAIAIGVTSDGPASWSGSITERQWQLLTLNDDYSGYQPATVGAARWNWGIPAYDPSEPYPGAPVDLLLSRNDYNVKCQPGTTIAAVVKTRPMSIITLPEGVGDNELFRLDHGRLVNLVRLPVGPLTVAVDETPQSKSGGVWSPQAGQARRTTLTLTGRR